MRTRFVVFGVVLAAAVAAAVSSAVAQAPPPEPRERAPRVWMLDGRGAQIGVTVEDADTGIRIQDVEPGSPAEEAGLQAGDVIVEVDGERVRSTRQFSRLIQESPRGRSVALGVMRNGARQSVDVTPESRTRTFDFGYVDGDRIGREIERGLRDLEPRLRALEPRLREELEPKLRELEPKLRELEPRLRDFRFDLPLDFDFDFDFDTLRSASPRGRLGVQLNELTPELADYFGAPDGGVLVARVTPDSPAHKAGLRAGDVITSVDGDTVRDRRDLVSELRRKEGEVTIGIVRDKSDTSVKATLER